MNTIIRLTKFHELNVRAIWPISARRLRMHT